MADAREEQSESIEKKGLQKSNLFVDHGKLWIKLKISPSDDDEEEEQEEDFAKENQKQLKSNDNITKICDVCNKVFRSGKALGGHMRIHNQTQKDSFFRRKQNKSSRTLFKLKKRNQEISDFAKKKDFNKSTCSICGKNFPSMKSLFGHMRCHPEREWRGIKPPVWAAVATGTGAAFVQSSPSLSSVSEAEPQTRKIDAHQNDLDDDQTIDLTKLLGGWSVTAKRSRSKANNIPGNSGEEEKEDDDEGMRDAVFHLMSLAQGDDDDSCEAKNKGEEFEVTNSNSLTSKTEKEEEIMMTKMGRKKQLLAGYIKDHPVKELRDEEKELDGFQIQKGKVETVQDTDLFFAGNLANLDCQWEEKNRPKEYYGDKDCSPEDSKYTHDQLLNHNNFESTNGNVMMFKSKKKRKRMKMRDLESVNAQVNPVLKLTTSPAEKYRCTTCKKCFPTHQALGGHRSSHNKFRMLIQNSIEDENREDYSFNKMEERIEEKCRNFNSPTPQALENLSSQGTSAGEVSRSGRRIMEFDLNKVPPFEDDAGVQSDRAFFSGHASSFFNSVGFSVF